MEDDRADELDPPTPALADGLYRWDYSDGYIVYITRKDGSWLDCNGKPDNEVHPQPDTKITRVRVLDDQHVAVDRSLIPSNDRFARVEEALQTACCPDTAAQFRSLQRALNIGGRS